MKYINKEKISELIPKEGTVVVSHAASAPKTIINEIVKNNHMFKNLEIIHMVPMGDAPYCDNKYENNFIHNSLFVGKATCEAVNKARAEYTPIFFSEVPNYIIERKPDVFILQVSREINGKVSLGVSVDYGKAALTAKTVIALQNPNMPYTFGDGEIDIKKIDYIVKGRETLFEKKVIKKTNEILDKIAINVKNEIPDGATLQLGIGNLPDTILSKLYDKNDLGIHSEMISDYAMALMKNGNITNNRKIIDKNLTVVSFVIGSIEFYSFLDQNPKILFKEVNYVNDPYIIKQNENVISINSCIQIDLQGQVNAETLNSEQISGVGGQVDFVRGAKLSKGGKSIIAFPSTDKNGNFSRIISKIDKGSVVTTTRNEVDYICTEYGCVKISGKTLRRRKELLISIAHPKFRKALKNGEI